MLRVNPREVDNITKQLILPIRDPKEVDQSFVKRTGPKRLHRKKEWNPDFDTYTPHQMELYEKWREAQLLQEELNTIPRIKKKGEDFPKSEQRNVYVKPDARLRTPREGKERYRTDMGTAAGGRFYLGPDTFDTSLTRCPLACPPAQYCLEMDTCLREPVTSVNQDTSKLPPVRTQSQEDEYLLEKLEKDRFLLHWKEWQYLSVPKLLHKFPTQDRIHADRALIPHQPGDPELIPFKHKRAYLRALRWRPSDHTHFLSEVRMKMNGLRVNHHKDANTVRDFLNYGYNNPPRPYHSE